MKKDIKILIVDDHPMIVEGYKNAILSMNLENYSFNIDIADNCDNGFQKIKTSTR